MDRYEMAHANAQAGPHELMRIYFSACAGIERRPVENVGLQYLA